MTPLNRYLAEEIATDHVDGLLTRREALRRLALLGVGAAAAGELIAACSKPDGAAESAKPTVIESSTGTTQPPGAANALPTAPITWAGPQGPLQGAWARRPIPRVACWSFTRTRD